VKARDKVCRHCNTDKGLQAHHIRSVSNHATMFLIVNGLTLCNTLHCQQKFRPEYFQDEVLNIIGQEKYDELKRMSQPTVDYSIADLRDEKELLKLKLVQLKTL
jgi:hypothetical protein